MKPELSEHSLRVNPKTLLAAGATGAVISLILFPLLAAKPDMFGRGDLANLCKLAVPTLGMTHSMFLCVASIWPTVPKVRFPVLGLWIGSWVAFPFVGTAFFLVPVAIRMAMGRTVVQTMDMVVAVVALALLSLSFVLLLSRVLSVFHRHGPQYTQGTEELI